MNCGQFEARLNLVIDQRRSPADDSALARHAAVCTNCDELLGDHMALAACVSHSRSPAPSYGFANRVVTAAGPAQSRERRIRRIWLAACVALSSAAAMLLAISIVWRARQAGPSEAPQLVSNGRITSGDLLLDAPRLWSNEVAMAAGGASLRLDEVERIAPGIKPFRESLAILWDALRRAFRTRQDATTPQAEDSMGRWALHYVALA